MSNMGRAIEYSQYPTGGGVGALAVGQTASAMSHRFGQQHMRLRSRLAPTQVGNHGAGMGQLDIAVEYPPGLHQLPSDVVDRGPAVIAGTYQRESIRNVRMTGKELRYLNLRRSSLNRPEWPANLRRCLGFRVERVEVTWTADIKNHDAG